MRSAKESNNFPYSMSTICYFGVDKNGNVSQVPHKTKADLVKAIEVYQRAVDETITLYAVWPGNWSSDLFIIDDLNAFAKELGLLDL